ncbi:EscU/YscU/HrcU family type III secretion system export apparatus switch protein [Kiloniella sp. EL199]|uniref:EscU/YscU/HrcU family type III secretion system export apparatus switch protein n=1 Tax=Kiloniella sp. EL199 TaxID=2107581 RepID=UPI000EA10FE6|nr:EscU/YscU/HrcU family type III secretion system export apparatus switch protein [Kiloniella sp. EL199]
MSVTDEDPEKKLAPSFSDTQNGLISDVSEEKTEDTPQLSIAVKRNTAGQTKVIAKGTGEIAEQILQIAFDQGVKVRTDSDLAQILANVELESEIPLEALTAVATILNYVYDEQKQPFDETLKQS